MSLEFGGKNYAMNSLYIPEHAQLFKQKFDKIIEELLIDEKKLNYSAKPEYKGKRFIPSKLKISILENSNFEKTTTIWQLNLRKNPNQQLLE